ncbi:MAG: DedA family protein [Bacteroidales bacterium]|jgi:membrane protein DedA with SNARE-associated domain|nr:DedA family protein [Bacteroidales bacterium]
MDYIATLTQWYVQNLNYWTITLMMTIESSFIPFPSEIVVPPAGYMAVAGNLNIWLVMLSSTAGALFGALINYGLAVFLGRPVIYWFADTRIGHILLLSGTKIQKAENYFSKYGSISTFMGRLVPGIRQFISIPAGLSRMKIHKFIFFTFVGAGIWNVFLTLLGYYLGLWSIKNGYDYDEVFGNNGLVYEYSHIVGYCFLAIAVLGVAYLVYKGFKKSATSK